MHAAQLLKHALGLRREFGPRRSRLLYLWYDVPGEAGAAHQREIDEFAGDVHGELRFQALTYQEFIGRIAARHRPEHEEYVDYLVERYL